MDTQWPRYEVFHQARDQAPVQSIGTVHAPDAEMALQNARDVFVRRPQTVSLWVVPASAILSRTAQELAAGTLPTVADNAGGPEQQFHVFQKTTQRRSMAYVTRVGKVGAPSAEAALARAVARFGEDGAFVWWIVPEAAIVRNEDEDAASMFGPAEDKQFRMPADYRTRSLMRDVKSKR